MALTTLQEVDPDDLSTILWDYGDQSGANNPGTVQAYLGVGGVFNLSAPGVQINTSNRLADGAQDVTFSYDDIVTSSFRVRFKAATYDLLRQGIGTLQRLLSADGVMKWIPAGSANTYYIYRKPSPIPALFTDVERGLYTRTVLADTPEGVEIVFNRERLLRGPKLLASVNALANSTLLLNWGAHTTNPDSWSWSSFTGITSAGYGANANNANQSYRFTIATSATRTLSQVTPPASAAPGDVWAFAFDARATGGALCKAQAVVQFMSVAPAVLATATGTLITLSSTVQRLSVVTSAAPASTDHIQALIQFANGDATSYTVDLRRAQLEKAGAVSQYRVGAEAVANDITSATTAVGGGKALFVYNPGDANALARLTLAPSNGAKTVAYNLARKAEGPEVNLLEAVNRMAAGTTSYRTKAIVVDKTMYAGNAGDTSSQVDAAATNGNAAKTTFTNQSSLVRRWRWVANPTDNETLHGTWDVFAVVRGEAGSAFRVGMHWQAANRDPAGNVEDEITYDCTDTTASIYTPLYLGQVVFNEDAGDTALTIEGWAARDDANANSLWWDIVYFVPADEQQTLLEVPGFRDGEQSKETWLGSELTVRGAGAYAVDATVSGTQVILDTQYEVVAMPPSTSTTGGLVFAAGRHVGRLSVQLQQNNGTSQTFGRFRARQAPGVGSTVPDWAATTVYAIGNFVKPTPGVKRNGRTYVVTGIGAVPHQSGGAEPTWPVTNGGTVVNGNITFTETTVAARALTNKANFTSTRYVGPDAIQVAFDADGSTAYEFVVAYDDGVNSGGVQFFDRRIHVMSMSHSTLRTVDDGYTAQMRGDIEELGTYNGAASIDDLVKSGPFITLGPGLNILWVDLWSLAAVAYDSVDPRDALAKQDAAQSTTVTVDVIPRYWG